LGFVDGTHDGLTTSSANEQFLMMGGMKDRPAPPPHTKNLLNLAAGNYLQSFHSHYKLKKRALNV
jgi:hypothetical protein